MKGRLIKGLYAIVDDSFPDPVLTAEKILAGGGHILQLRAKKMSSAKFLETAIAIRSACAANGALLIINDRVDIAMMSGADGVHLGQDDLPIEATRKVLGREKIIGVSTHNMGEACRASKDGANYVGFGPVFRTATKGDAHEVQGLERLKEISAAVKIPLVAIGGISEWNMRDVLDAGADAVAVISAIASASDISGKTAELVAITGAVK